MQLVEQHRIDRHDSRFAAIDAAAFASKNLYNALGRRGCVVQPVRVNLPNRRFIRANFGVVQNATVEDTIWDCSAKSKFDSL
jgi:hypothetical protein